MRGETPDASDGPDAQRREGAEGAEPADARGRPSTGATGDAVRQDLAQALADLARRLQRQSDPLSVMQTIIAAVPGTIPGAEDATVSLVQNRQRVLSAAFTSARARRFDELQQETHQGPCLDAMYQQQTVRVDDLAADPRWPTLACRVAEELGVASMLSFQLFVHANDLGSLNLLAYRPNAFTDESERIGLLFASHAAIALADAQDLDNVATALTRRDLISQAKGILWSGTRSPRRQHSPYSPRPARRRTPGSTTSPKSSPELACSVTDARPSHSAVPGDAHLGSNMPRRTAQFRATVARCPVRHRARRPPVRGAEPGSAGPGPTGHR